MVPVEAKWGVTEKVGEIENNTGIFKATKVGRGLVVAYYKDIATTAEVEVNPGELEHIFLEPNPVTIASNSVQAFEAKGLDSEKNSLSLPALQWKVEGEIGMFEKPKVFRAIKEGKGKVIATVGKLQAEAYVTVVPGEPDTENSRLRIARSTVPSDGKTTSEVIVEVRDVHNNPVSGVVVKFISDRQDDLIEQPAKTDQQGTSRGYISSTKPGKATLTAVIKDQTLRDTAEVVFKE